ncbi:MAG TPA: AraC family transcriptional regulator [Planctomycetota bacterium]|nr:AraC family transcriptional regulator [Planctomycetota bacterium]
MASASVDWATLLDDPAVSVVPTLLGFPRARFTAAAGWDTGLRAIEQDLVYVVARGRMTAALAADALVAVGAGELCFVPAGAPFRFVAARPAPTVERFRLVATRGADRLTLAAAPFAVRVDADLRRALDGVLAELARADVASAALRATGATLLIALARSAGPAQGGLAPALLARLAAFVERDPWCSPRDLARAAGLTHDWFTRAFRRATGVAPRAWIVRERIRLAAARLAAGDETAEAVAQAIGYRDAKLFGRQFRAVLGAPPAAWRRRAAPFA